MNEGLVKEAVKFFPKKVSVGLDLIGDFVAIKGWTEVFKEREAVYFFKKFYLSRMGWFKRWHYFATLVGII